MGKIVFKNYTKIKIYSGLTLSKDDVWRALPFADFSGPIKREDLLIDIDSGYRIVAIVDGQFDQREAVSPCEIMDALRCGVSIYGCSSMGALRAAELEPFGMVGFGEIFNLIKNTPGFRDDLLGQVFWEDPASLTSAPFVDFYFYCKKKQEKEPSLRAPLKKLLSVYQDLHFSSRNLEDFQFEFLARHPNQKEAFGHFKNFLRHKSSQKKIDAKGMLRKIKADLVDVKKTNQLILNLQKSSRLDPTVGASNGK